MRGRVLLVSWAVVLLAIVGLGFVVVAIARNEPPLNVRRVVGEGPNLWAETNERVLLQGAESVWWVSHDGGSTWSRATPPVFVETAAPLTEVCNPSTCHRLVDGWRIERRAVAEGPWEVEYERARDRSPTGYEGYTPDWEEVPAIATTNRTDRDEVVAAAGRDGALVRTAAGRWHSVPVGEPLLVRYLPWLITVLATVLVVCGVAGHLVIRRLSQRARRDSNPQPSDP